MSTFTAFVDQTAARIAPDRAERWLKFWDSYSSEIPDEMPEAEYSKVALDAWVTFRKQDETDQADAISRAWGVKQFKKLPRLAPRKSQPQAQATVVYAKKWTPCAFWRGEKCDIHNHAIAQTKDDTPYLQAQGMFEIHSRFVRRRILVELQPWAGEGRHDVTDVESMVWWNVAKRMAEYVPSLQTHLDKVGNYWTSSTKQEQARAQMWLRAIVHTTVLDTVRGNHAEKRDIDREVQTDFDLDHGVADPAAPVWSAQPVRPKGAGPDGNK